MHAVHYLVTAGASLFAAAAFLVLGFSLWQREYPGRARGPGRAYATWWLLVGFMCATDALRILESLGGAPRTTEYVALSMLKIVLTAAAIALLAHYVLYLWTGHRRGAWLAGVFGVVHGGLFLWLLVRGLPAVVHVETWGPRLELTQQSLPIALGLAGALLFFLPPVVLAGAFLALWRRMPQRTQRVRVVAVSLTVIAFFLVSSIQFNPGTSRDAAYYPVFSLVTVLAAVVVFAAYHPPAWLRSRLRLEAHTHQL